MHLKRISIFIIGVILIAVVGAWIANGIDKENPTLQVSGILLMSLSPLMLTVVLKAIYRDGWTDIGLRFGLMKNFTWYFLSGLIPAMLVAFVIGLSCFSSAVSLKETFVTELPEILLKSFGLFLAFLVASIGEELGWRGFLQSEISKINSSLMLNHFVVGIVWFVWHLPLILMAEKTSVYELSMILASTLGMAVVYGQLRQQSGTIWTCVLLHAFSNALLIGFGTSKVLVVKSDAQQWVSLSSFSLSVVAYWTLAAISILMVGRKHKKTPVEHWSNHDH